MTVFVSRDRGCLWEDEKFAANSKIRKTQHNKNGDKCSEIAMTLESYNGVLSTMTMGSGKTQKID